MRMARQSRWQTLLMSLPWPVCSLYPSSWSPDDQDSYFLILESEAHSWSSHPLVPLASHGDIGLPTSLFPEIPASLTWSENLSSGFQSCFLFSWNFASPTPTLSSGSQEVHCLQDASAACSLLLATHLHPHTVPRLGLHPSCPNPWSPFSLTETVRAMTHVINQGMAMYWGTSRWSSMEIMVG